MGNIKGGHSGSTRALGPRSLRKISYSAAEPVTVQCIKAADMHFRVVSEW